MKAIIAGSTGMIGNLILQNCLNSDKIKEVVSLVRKPTGAQHEKLNEIVINDFINYDGQSELFKNVGAAFFCIGVYTGQVDDHKFREITVDYAVGFAEALKDNSPNSKLCFLSGGGADRTEKSKMAFAKYKGIAENKISSMNFNFFHVFRPGYIYPVTPRDEPNFTYKLSRFLYPVIKLFGNNASIKSTELAGAMFQAGLNGTTKEILENRDIINDIVKKK